MKIHQISLFIENRKGQLRIPTQILAEAGINIRTLSLADTEQFGILRLIIDDWQKAKEVLEKAGCVVKVAEVIAVKVPDRPGRLDELLATIEDAGLNIEYMYAFTFGREDKPIMFFRFEDADAAAKALTARGINLVSGEDLYQTD